MIKRIQIALTEENWATVEATLNEANQNNKLGNISISDAINEMILTSKVDIRSLQYKHADLRKTLRSIAEEDDLDLKSIIKSLSELQSKIGKSQTKHAPTAEGSAT
jgi:hypothetical protein